MNRSLYLPLPVSNIVKDNSNFFVNSFCFLFIKDFSCGRVRSRNRVLPPQALTLGTLNRLVISLISYCCCIRSRSNFVVQAICSASKAELEKLTVVKQEAFLMIPGVASFLIFVAI